jgi:hypothetical protein
MLIKCVAILKYRSLCALLQQHALDRKKPNQLMCFITAACIGSKKTESERNSNGADGHFHRHYMAATAKVNSGRAREA